jgi:hypothetical protein
MIVDFWITLEDELNKKQTANSQIKQIEPV